MSRKRTGAIPCFHGKAYSVKNCLNEQTLRIGILTAVLSIFHYLKHNTFLNIEIQYRDWILREYSY